MNAQYLYAGASRRGPRLQNIAERNLAIFFSLFSFAGDRRHHCDGAHCRVTFINLHCGTKRRRFRDLITRRNPARAIITVEFELKMLPQTEPGDCNVTCVRERTKRRLKRTLKSLRRSMSDDQFKLK